MPKADATELAPKKSAEDPPARPCLAGGSVIALFSTRRVPRPSFFARPQLWFSKPHFFGEASERRPWAIKREDRPAAFAGRSSSRFYSFGGWDTYRAYTGEYPIPPWHVLRALRARLSVGDCEKPAGKDLENVGRHDCDALHIMSRVFSTAKYWA